MPWTAEPHPRRNRPSDVALVQPGDGRDPDKDPFARGPVLHLMSPTAARAPAADLVRAAEAVEPMVERSCYTCAYNKNAVCYHPPDELEMAIDQYAVDAGCAKNNGGLPLDRSIPCPGHTPKVTP